MAYYNLLIGTLAQLRYVHIYEGEKKKKKRRKTGNKKKAIQNRKQ